MMKRLRALPQAAKLRLKTHLRPQIAPANAPQVESLAAQDGQFRVDLKKTTVGGPKYLLDARDLLNGLLEIKPSFANYLAPSADIVHSPEFKWCGEDSG
ncbi:hypothetical protein PI126_g9549 [Phytophthora idaei]|nr:hypothetical protein PI126_g9549 [Phytophthora idaei]